MPHRFRLLEAALPLLVTALLLMGSVVFWSVRFYWPLAAGALVAAALAYRAGFSPNVVLRAAIDGMKSTLIPLIILVLIGGLIGVWMAAGTVPAMVYYGLGFVDPQFLVPVAFVLSLVTSMMLGTTIGTLSTLGVALMGVAQGLGAPLPLVAGALVSGALVGDRTSPLSGSLHVNVAMTGTELRRVLVKLVPTGVIGVSLALVGYFIAGRSVMVTDVSAGMELRALLGSHLVITPVLLTPPVIVLGLSLARVPVRWALGAGILGGVALIFLRLGQPTWIPLEAALLGFQADVGDEGLNRVLSGGGVLPMMHQVILILVAGAFNGIMEATGMMSLVITSLVKDIRRPSSLVGTTMMISLAVALLAANQILSIIVPGRMLRETYREIGAEPEVLARTLADSGTVLAALIPWNLLGLLAGASLGIPAVQYGRYAFLPLILPVVSFGYALWEEYRIHSGRTPSGQVQALH